MAIIKTSKTYSFFNHGSYFFFNPNKPLQNPADTSVNENYLAFHLRLVREANHPAVYVLDESGKEVMPYQ